MTREYRTDEDLPGRRPRLDQDWDTPVLNQDLGIVRDRVLTFAVRMELISRALERGWSGVIIHTMMAVVFAGALLLSSSQQQEQLSPTLFVACFLGLVYAVVRLALTLLRWPKRDR